MSRAFLKDDTSGDQPIIPPRAALPPGSINYVTPRGLELLRQERSVLEAERAMREADRENDADRAWQLTILNGRLAILNERISSAKLVEPGSQTPDEVRFGTTVALKTKRGGQPGMIRKFTIVGVDEASVAEGRIGFIAPIARAVLGAKRGQEITLRLGLKEDVVEVIDISYDQDSENS